MSLRYIYSPRYLVRLILAFFNRFKVIIAIGVLFGIVVFITLNLLLPNLNSTSQRIGLVGRFTTTNLPSHISEKISSGLTKVEVDGNVVPALAKSWETTDEGKTWTFTLDETKVWQDGKKIQAKDITYTFNDATVDDLDNLTIKFSLDSNFAAFPIIVSKPLFKKGLLGTAEYEVKNISLVGGYVQKLTIINKNGDKILYKFYPSEDRLKLAFKLGEIDAIERSTEKEAFKEWKGVNITEEVSYSNIVAIFINTEDEKLSEKTLRQALAYAIDKDNFGETRALGPLSPYSWGYNPQVKPYTKDLEKTKELKELTIKLSTLPNLLQVAEKVANNWKNSGAVVEIETVSEIPENYQALLATVDIPKDPDQYSLWHSTQVETNISKYKNVRIDKLLEDGRKELDQEARKKIYLDFQRFLVEDVPAIFLYHPTLYTISRK